ncbi:sigma 54-interacting response regulator [Mucilaginibacter ginsenosidivorax]|uniref:Response regulator n=1 Tax=Mucilaginibacter ginsenosidivorax TaxID=862126 RepID=A0A5B8VSZ5_9SPHI|nr:sigma 54-interacting response regulator [Mucilaginibacter ginsenosidivorax]QEC74764.1 response regulator [Mucilaginibacter ginsenosidivorax]
MEGKILIVEDEFIIASDLRMILERAGYEIAGIASSVSKALEIISLKKPAWVFLDIYLIGKLTGIDLANQLVEMRIPFIYVSANSNQSVLELAKATKPYGFLVKPFREKDVLVTLDVAKYRHEHDLEAKLLRETMLQDDVMRVLAGVGSKNEKLLKIISSLQQYIPFDFFLICWKGEEEQVVDGLGFYKKNEQDFELIDKNEFVERSGKSTEESNSWNKYVTPDSKSVLLKSHDFSKMCRTYKMDKQIALAFNLQSILAKSIPISDSKILTFSFYGRATDAFTPDQSALLNRLNLLLIKICDCIPNLADFIELKSIAKVTTTGDLKSIEKSLTKLGTDETLGLIGNSPNFKAIKDKLSTVASFDISVLLLGESGTGKEKIARAIHKLSPRANKPMIKVNCAAIPATLIESELFGHEKGAFTGAVDLRIGKFEQAIGGTIFLDEIGELPLDMQVKLLCVLQEREIVRLGSNKVIKTDVRVIAATNLNLEKAIAEGKFRLDLYYRLNGFPIWLPPLRERKEDIPQLVAYFLLYLSDKMGKKLQKVSTQAMDDLIGYPWPGNIRELENLIERSIVLNEGDTIKYIDLPIISTTGTSPVQVNSSVKTIKEMERDYIMEVLKKCNGKVSGPGGAAELLDIPPNTLVAKIKKLGIVKNYL